MPLFKTKEEPKEEVSWGNVPLERTRKGWHGEMENREVDIKIKAKGWIHPTYKIFVKDKLGIPVEGGDKRPWRGT